jgi:hypothetical protein
VEGLWTSRRFINDVQRLEAIEKRTGKKLTRGWLWRYIGSPTTLKK